MSQVGQSRNQCVVVAGYIAAVKQNVSLCVQTGADGTQLRGVISDVGGGERVAAQGDRVAGAMAQHMQGGDAVFALQGSGDLIEPRTVFIKHEDLAAGWNLLDQ